MSVVVVVAVVDLVIVAALVIGNETVEVIDAVIEIQDARLALHPGPTPAYHLGMPTPRLARPVASLVAVAVAALALLPACGDDPAGGAADADPTRPDADPSAPDAGSTGVGPVPPANAPVDYQLGGAYPPPAGVMIVSRDRTAAPAPGLYNICYVNGFQIQPDEEAMWLADHPDLILRDGQGNPVIDVDWNEMLIDVGTPAKREAVAAIVGDWIRGCVGAGYDAIEIDNLDSFSRSGGRLVEADAVAAMRLFADAAHAAGVPIAQKNSAEIVGRRAELGTDFVVAEECNRYGECGVYTGAYGDAVIVIEYRRADFATGCRDFPQLSIVLRDLDLVPAGAGGYVFEGC